MMDQVGILYIYTPGIKCISYAHPSAFRHEDVYNLCTLVPGVCLQYHPIAYKLSTAYNLGKMSV